MKTPISLLFAGAQLAAISACSSAAHKYALDSATNFGDGQDQRQVVYVQSNNHEHGTNSILAFDLGPEGILEPIPGSPFLTGGTGIDNATNGKLGPNDNDTPLAIDGAGEFLFAVNGHSDTIAVMDIRSDGSLAHVQGSPFPSRGIHPVSLAVAGGFLLVAHRNEDPQRLPELSGAAQASYTSFRVGDNGQLSFVSESVVESGGKPTQVVAAKAASGIVFGNDFQVDADFDGDGLKSRLFGNQASVQGGIHTFKLSMKGELQELGFTTLPETNYPAPEVPSIPLGLSAHPKQNLIYAGFVTRNELGVFRYDDGGNLEFVAAVPNSGQDICWLTTNRSGTRLYAVNNLPRIENGDRSSTLTVFDISGSRAENPIEMQRIALPLPLGTFINNRNAAQPNSTAFQLALDQEEQFLFVVNQRIDQTGENNSDLGNMLHVLRVREDGKLAPGDVRDLNRDGVSPRSRPQGVVSLSLP